MIRRPWAAVAAGTVALLALHAVLVRPVHGFLLSDTTGYLANARWLAGEAGGTWLGPSSFYHPLWSLLVAPIYAVLDSPRDVQVGALVLNAVLAAAVLPAAYVLGRRAFALPPRPATAAAVVAATYPAVLLLSGYEWAEPLYQLLFVGWALAAAAVVVRPDWRPAVAVGAAAAALNATHPRGIGTVAVTAVVLVLVARRHRPALAGLGVLAALFLLTRVVSAALLDAIYSDTSAGVEGDVLGRLTDPSLLWGGAKAALGQVWYLTVASLGLVPIGALWLARSRRVPRPAGWTILAGALATLAASALQMSDGTRVDHMVYGRYLEGVVPVLLVAGAAAVVAWRSELPKLLGLTTAAGAAVAVALVAVRGGDLFRGDVMPLNLTGILVVRRDSSEVDVLVVSLAALGGAVAVVLAARWRALAGLGVAALVFAGSAVSVQARTLRPFDEQWAGFVTLPDVVRELGGVTDLSIDRPPTTESAGPVNLYQTELSDLEVHITDGRPPTDLVIGPERWPAADAWDARLVAVEVGAAYDQGLWVLPGRLQDRLQARGWLLPRASSAPLPAVGRRQRVAADLPSDLGAGDRRTIDVTIGHAGGGAAWRPVDDRPPVVEGTVRLGARWFDADGREVDGGTTDLVRVMGPGSTQTLELELVAPARPGRYGLAIGLRQEGIAWFPRPASFTVDVR